MGGIFSSIYQRRFDVPHWLFVLAVTGIFVRRIMRLFRRIQEHAYFGCLNPAKILSVEPGLIAVYTDLSSTPYAEWPVIKIAQANFRRVSGPSLKVGDRVPAVALYSGEHVASHWRDFFPLPVQFLTDDQSVIRRCMDRLTKYEDGAEWAALDYYLAQVATPTTPGLYEFGPARVSIND